MNDNSLKEKNILESVNRFKSILEYVNLGQAGKVSDGRLEEDGEAPMPDPSADPAMGGAPADPAMGGAPDMGGAPADPAMGGAPADPAIGGAPADPAAGGMPGQENAGGVEGFAPEEEGAEAEPQPDEEPEEDEEVIDVDELVDSQENTEKKLSRMSRKFDRLIDALNSLERNLDANSANMENIRQEMEKRNPTPVEKLSLRSRMSGPYDKSVDEYWDEKEATSPNYSAEDDNNGEDDEIYKITKSDIDNEVNWQDIAKSLDDDSLKPMGLRDILGI